MPKPHELSQPHKPIELIITDIGILATPEGDKPKSGDAQGKINFIENAYIAVGGDKIVSIGPMAQLKNLPLPENITKIDAKGRLVTPGLVDPHTHLIFGGWRQKELSYKLKGMGYLDILGMGGGILSTVRHTRKTSLEELIEKGRKSLDRMLCHGTTTCEAKSGYGLTTEDEIKSLKAIEELNKSHPVDIVPTFMGAHAVPEEYKDNPSKFVDIIIDEMIPEVSKAKLAKFCDVFCEDKVFGIEQSRRILECAKSHGLTPKIHADEITPLGGAALAAEVGAITAEHLIHADDEGLEAMAKSGVIAVLLPGTSLFLGASFARAKKMMELGIPIALATDFNPGSSPTESLQLIMNLACMKYKMTPEQVLTAVTLNSAAAIDKADTVGTLEPGKLADILIWDAPDLDFILYRFGSNLVDIVIKKGKVVVTY